MRTRPFGWTGWQVPVIGQGTWNLERADRAQAIAALRRGIELGMTHIDTAELYGAGRVEELVAEAIEGRRDQVFLVSKVWPEHASRQGTIAACEQSLHRLRTDRLDVYLLHWPSQHPLAETLAAFTELERAGKIRAFGVSNFDDQHLESALKIAGERRIACNQVLYHLEERSIEHAVLPWCERHQVAVVAYSPFGSGHFPAPQSKGGRVLARIGQAHSATPHQVALAFLTRRPFVFAIPKAATVAHVVANAAAADLQLTARDLHDLDAAFPLGPRPKELPTL
jgi:diketogulonate reductase-like aldo/keto reductase